MHFAGLCLVNDLVSLLWRGSSSMNTDCKAYRFPFMLDFPYKMCGPAIILCLISDDLVMADLYCVYLISTPFSVSESASSYLNSYVYEIMHC